MGEFVASPLGFLVFRRSYEMSFFCVWVNGEIVKSSAFNKKEQEERAF